jgi:hypothetical protein
MADIVGLIASLFQLVDVIAKAHNYIRDLRDAPEDQQRLILEIQNLKKLLTELDKRVKIDKAATVKVMQEVEGPLMELKLTMDRLTKKLHSEGSLKISSRLTWPLWGKEEVQEGLNGIERFKSLVNAWLGLHMLFVISKRSIISANPSTRDCAQGMISNLSME